MGPVYTGSSKMLKGMLFKAIWTNLGQLVPESYFGLFIGMAHVLHICDRNEFRVCS